MPAGSSTAPSEQKLLHLLAFASKMQSDSSFGGIGGVGDGGGYLALPDDLGSASGDGDLWQPMAPETPETTSSVFRLLPAYPAGVKIESLGSSAFPIHRSPGDIDEGAPASSAVTLSSSSSSGKSLSGDHRKYDLPAAAKLKKSSSPAAPSTSATKRSQKLGDKITALQQLVSPFGKTDTASVLHEATICIKLLHEQIKVLTAPYFRSRWKPSFQGGETTMLASDLRSRGMCLAPYSTTTAYLAELVAAGDEGSGRHAPASAM